MANNIVEVGFLLPNELDFYEQMLNNLGADRVFMCETHDKYWTNKSFNELVNLTENQIKKSCIRLRECSSYDTLHCIQNPESFSFDNYSIFKNTSDNFKIDKNKINEYITELENNGFYLIFDTFKRDYHYKIGDMNSLIQLQEIDNIGLVLYYDNPDYYEMPEKLQRQALIDELNSYGFDFKYDELGIDKLRTLLTGTSCFSLNQNG